MVMYPTRFMVLLFFFYYILIKILKIKMFCYLYTLAILYILWGLLQNNASYVMMVARNIRGRCWWEGSSQLTSTEELSA